MSSRFRPAALLLAGLLSLTPTLFCQAQEPLGYALPEGFEPGTPSLGSQHVAFRGFVDFSQPGSHPQLVTRTYLVAELAVALAVPPKDGKAEVDKTGERLGKLLKSMVAPESWEGKGGRGTLDYYPLGMTIVVNQTADVHERIAELLNQLRKNQDAEIVVEAQIIRVPESFAKKIGLDVETKPADAAKVRFLDQEQAKKLCETLEQHPRTNLRLSPKIAMANGQDAQFQCLDKQEFITGVDLRWDGDKGVGVQHKEAFETGVSLSVQPVVLPEKKCVRMHFQMKLTDLDEKKSPASSITYSFSSAGKEQGTVCQFTEMPKFTTVNVDRMLTIPDGSTALLSGWKREVKYVIPEPVIPGFIQSRKIASFSRETECLLILVKPQVLASPEPYSTGQPSSVVETPVMPRADGDEETSEPESKPQSEIESNTSEMLEKGEAVQQLIEFLRDLLKLSGIGWYREMYPDNVNKRLEEQFSSEEYQEIQADKKLFWFIDQPSRKTVERIHGDVE
jgi:Bacterial type II and III secretion system protein